MKAVLDASVYLSMLLSPRGSGAWLMDLWGEERYELVISPELFAEFVEVSNQPRVKTHIDPQRKLALFRRLRQDAIWITEAIEAQGLPADPADDFLMSAALEAEAEFIVTWDSLLLDQKKLPGSQDPVSRSIHGVGGSDPMRMLSRGED
jgi:putative PIN family toxin of toxin-antitoxin system